MSFSSSGDQKVGGGRGPEIEREKERRKNCESNWKTPPVLNHSLMLLNIFASFTIS